MKDTLAACTAAICEGVGIAESVSAAICEVTIVPSCPSNTDKLPTNALPPEVNAVYAVLAFFTAVICAGVGVAESVSAVISDTTCPASTEASLLSLIDLIVPFSITRFSKTSPLSTSKSIPLPPVATTVPD